MEDPQFKTNHRQPKSEHLYQKEKDRHRIKQDLKHIKNYESVNEDDTEELEKEESSD